jgi:hypothetical protein
MECWKNGRILLECVMGCPGRRPQGGGGIAGDLGGGGGGIGEGHVAAQAAGEGDLDVLAVEVAGEAGDVDLDDLAEVRLGGIGRIGHEAGAGMGAVAEEQAHGIDAGRGADGQEGLHIGGGEADGAADLAAVDDGAHQREGAAEHVLGQGRSPARTAARMRVLEMGAPSSSMCGTSWARRPTSWASPGRVSRLPARSLPKVKFWPTTISARAGNSSLRSARKSAGPMAASSRVKGKVWICRMPQAAMRVWFCAGVSSRRGARAGFSNWATCGKKVRQPGTPPQFRAASTAAWKTAWWPRWTPSNWPMARTRGLTLFVVALDMG